MRTLAVAVLILGASLAAWLHHTDPLLLRGLLREVGLS